MKYLINGKEVELKCNTCKRKKHCANCRVVHRQGCMRHTKNEGGKN